MSRRIEKAAAPSLGSSALDHSLRLLEQIGEATNLGVLKGFAGVVHLVLDTCQNASGNKDEAMALAQDVGQLAMAVVGQVEELKDDIGADTELLDQISKLCLELEAVHSVLKNLFKRGSFTWLLKQSQDEVKLQRLQRDIKHAIDLFSFQTSVRLQGNISRSETLDATRKGRILDEIKEVCQTVMDEIKEAGKQTQVPPLLSKAVGPVVPRVPRDFFGREEPIAAVVTTIIAPTPGRVAILGAAGIGKTSVALMVLADSRVVECFGDRRYFISCDAARAKDDLLTAIAGPLGLQGDKLQKKILEALGQPEHRTVIVLDNFESPWDSNPTSRKEVESFLASLCALNTLAVIITMRGSERPAGVQWSRPFLPQLAPLDGLSARKAFLALSDCLEDDPWIDPLLTAIDCVPLAIALMANLAQTDSTETLLARWREEHSSLLHRTPDRRSSLDISIGISLNSPRMKAVPEALTLLSLISLLPDGVDNSELAAIFPSIGKSRRALSALWQTSLAYNDGHNRTRVLSPIRAHMLLYHQSDTAHRVSVMTYYMGLAGLSSDLGGPHGQVIVKRLTPEIGNLHSVVNLTFDSTEEVTMQPLLRGAIAAAINLSKFLRYTHLGNPETVRLAAVAASKLGDSVLRADVLYHLAWISLTISMGGQGSDPESLCREALTLYEENENVTGRAECTWLLGQIYKATKRGKECKGLYEQALELAVQSQNKYCQAKCLSNLSEMTFYSGDAKTAEDLSQQALTIFRELESLVNIGMTLFMLARIAAFNNDRRADALFEEAGVFLEKAGAHRQACLAINGKGDCAFARCDFYAAREAYIKAINVLEENGSLQSVYGAYAELSLGTAAAYLYDYLEANRWLGEAWRTMEKTSAVTHGHMHCDIIYGDLAFYETRFEEAVTLYRRALLAAESLGYPEEEALCRVKLGTLELARARPWMGVRHLIVASATQRRISDVKGLSQTLVRLGECFMADDDTATALLFFRTAYPVCRGIHALRNVAGCLVGLGTVCGNREQVVEGATLYEQTGDTKGYERCKVLLASM
ncbi:hypothetical protein MVEN_02070700 [Mycena venus]|uniref:Novel STAND NTPase 1 domain-containing protein n=1 Tax=Mycena venus TaxID=2733690 RepID=A0A8H6XBU9_9AGAR|nr:hypothetical protein MVEN_02070700 [Mycena venus]